MVVHNNEPAVRFAGQPQGTSTTIPPERGPFECNFHSEFSQRVDAQIDAGDLPVPTPTGRTFLQYVRRLSAMPYDEKRHSRYVQANEKAVDDLRELAESVRSGNAIDLESLTDHSKRMLRRAAYDVDMFTCLAINPYFSDYPYRHSMHTAALAAVMAINMGLEQQAIIELEIGCLIHDNGMLLLENPDVSTSQVFDHDRAQLIAQHSVLALDFLGDDFDRVAASSRMVAYQMHERCNGTGYPRRRPASQIHPLAKIAMVADVYIALVSERPHRPGMLPHHAVRHIVQNAIAGNLDINVVRALLKSICLYPLGSSVELSDQSIGRVIRLNGERYDRPVVEILKASNTKAELTIVDLSQREDLEVRRSIGAQNVD